MLDLVDPVAPFDFAEAMRPGPRIDADAMASAPPITCTTAGHCDRCGIETVGKICDDCVEHIGGLAEYRPSALVLAYEGEHEDNLADWAVLRLPSSVPHRGRVWWVAMAITLVVTDQLDDGAPFSVAFRHNALGRDRLASKLGRIGHPMDRKTVAYTLDELVGLAALTRTGRMPAWFDADDATMKSGAHLYALTVEVRAVGGAALAHILSSAASWGNRAGTRIERALKWAIENARPGERNAIGHWLTRRCVDVGLSEVDAQALLGRYVAAVEQSKHRFSGREAQRTVASVYRRI